MQILSPIRSSLGRRGALHAVLAFVTLTVVMAGCAGVSRDDPTEGTRDGAPHHERGREPHEGESAVAGMSVGEMVGQMFVVSVGGTEPDYYIEKMVRERNIGGVILFSYNMKSEGQTRSLVCGLQELSMQTKPEIPLFVAVDQEGGAIASAPWVGPEPAAAAVGRGGDSNEARRIAARMGRQLLRAGINTDLAPLVDAGHGAAIGNRSFGKDPELVARMGAAAVKGFREAGVVSSAKHYPNHGPAGSDSHVSLPVIRHDDKELENRDLPPFRAAIDAGVPMVMVGHLVYPAIDPERPASLSRDAMNMLRGDLGFDGVVVTDDLAMAGATGGGTVADAAVKAVGAGADLLIISSAPQEQADAYDAVVGAVRSGEIPRSRVEESVGRLLAVKETYDLRAPCRH
jgi:beta-N-acetylhexosaminidase